MRRLQATEQSPATHGVADRDIIMPRAPVVGRRTAPEAALTEGRGQRAEGRGQRAEGRATSEEEGEIGLRVCGGRSVQAHLERMREPSDKRKLAWLDLAHASRPAPPAWTNHRRTHVAQPFFPPPSRLPSLPLERACAATGPGLRLTRSLSSEALAKEEGPEYYCRDQRHRGPARRSLGEVGWRGTSLPPGAPTRARSRERCPRQALRPLQPRA
jgi:hypothetical protein